ncbi:MAG TPA: hypothetical protein VMU80_03400 [Bryobacteraceae bacterium]|nr:hypothetical protein [Bryobacteraceae bacterium]
MLKKFGLPVIALLGVLAMAPHQANAAVRVGVVVGCRPAPVVVRHDFHRDWRYRPIVRYRR